MNKCRVLVRQHKEFLSGETKPHFKLEEEFPKKTLVPLKQRLIRILQDHHYQWKETVSDAPNGVPPMSTNELRKALPTEDAESKEFLQSLQELVKYGLIHRSSRGLYLLKE